MSYAKRKNLTVYDVLIIASMIDKEVQIPQERDDVAAVIYNRLSQGQPLGIDATTRYETQNYTEQILRTCTLRRTPRTTPASTPASPRRRSATPDWPRSASAARERQLHLLRVVQPAPEPGAHRQRGGVREARRRVPGCPGGPGRFRREC